jgi:hypothetical protein
MSTMFNTFFLSYSTAPALRPAYADVPMRSPATSLVLAEAVRRGKTRSRSVQATVQEWLLRFVRYAPSPKSQPEA